ncbi:MAG: hypothetical protein JNK65_08295, partial [Deltaproteobacteria bacterium]|nr:hypothetical protein [Deltaproteobacteria bacterium]
ESKPTNEKEDDSDEYSTELKLDNDYYVKLANKLILQAPGNDRQEILKNSLNVEKASEQEEDEKIKQAFSVIGIDWSKAEPSASPQANISFHLEGKNTNEAIKAGEEAQLTLTVQNTGKGDFYQLIAKIESENILLKNKEFVFGHVKSGETKSWTTKVKIPDTVLSREDVLKFVFREANNKNPEPFSTLIAFEPKDRPSFAYSYHLEPKTLQKGNNYSLVLKVKNMGSGKSKETIVNLKNMEGEGIYISEGRNKLGEMEPGSTKEAKLAFNISKTFAKDKVGLEFSIVDTSTQESLVDKVSFPLDKELNPKPDVVQLPPKIELNGMSGIRSSSSNKFPISGTITSETPIKDVIIFVGENKVFLKPADPASPKKLVFSTQVPLEVKNNNSNNLVIVVSRDERDLTSHESFFIRKK